MNQYLFALVMVSFCTLIIGCKESREQQFYKALYNSFVRSIEYNKVGELKSETEKEEAIRIRKIEIGLGSDWTFVQEELKTSKAEKIYDALINYSYIFENNKNNAVRVYHETYYYDLESIQPVPLKHEAFEIIGDKNTSLYHRYLWNGDFSDYMRYYFPVRNDAYGGQR